MRDERKDPTNPYLSAASSITLRDLFAAAVLCGLWADPNAVFSGAQEAAETAYQGADAMLKERAK